MTLGIGAVLVQRDGELDQKYRKVARERGAFLAGTSGGHIRLDIMRPPSMVTGTSGHAGPAQFLVPWLRNLMGDYEFVVEGGAATSRDRDTRRYWD
mgnify:CR=1 FL=1